MDETAVDPLEINKDPQIIKDAQTDIGKLDVLVCGECHEVFYFVEEFQEHKSGKCTKTSLLKENYTDEPKTQVWAFMLWKQAQLKQEKDTEVKSSSWVVYQKWCKLDTSDRAPWVTAAQDIQSFNKISTAKVQELKLKPVLTTKKIITKPKLVTVSSFQSLKSNSSDDPLDEGEIPLSQLANAQKLAQNEQKNNQDVDPLADVDTQIDIEKEIERITQLDTKKTDEKLKENDLIKKGMIKSLQLNSDVTILPSNKQKVVQTKKGIRTSKDEKRQYAVEKIVSKRYNPRKKTFEYLIKWENFDSDQNTWEPPAHITGCKELLEEFEKNLQKQKLERTNKANILQKRAEKNKSNVAEKIELTPGGRPQRTSKQKALNQVKVWCGDISDADDGTPSKKRAAEDDDDSDSDSFEKRMKLDEESEESEEEKPTVTIRRIPKPASVNGVGKKNILLTDSQGVVRLNTKQVSSLRTGVYIMNKNKELIKLDSNTAKIPTRTGSSTSTLHVTPKIVGETRIKVIRKDSNSPGNIVRVGSKTPTLITKLKPPLKVASKVNNTVVKSNNLTEKDKSSKEKIEPNKPTIDDDDSDGIEEMEFPTDLPLPEPDSPPGEFTLDPITGKIVGEEYPEETEQVQNQDSTASTENSLDNLVKMAVADIDDESTVADVEPKLESVIKEANVSTTEETLTIEEKLAEMNKESDVDIPNTQSISNIDETSVKTVVTSSSILCTALTDVNQPNVVEKKLLTTPAAIQQKNTTNKPVPSKGPVIRTVPSNSKSPYRNRPITPKGKMPLTSMPVISRIPPKNTYSNKSIALKKQQGASPVKQITTATVTETKAQPQTTVASKETKQNVPSTGVINMPLLGNDDEMAGTKNEETAELTTAPAEPEVSNLTTLAIPETDSPLFITGDDGTIYQIAGQNEHGQTVLISQGADGQQQCLVVATEHAPELNQMVSLEENVAIAESEMVQQQPLMINTEEQEMQLENGDTQVDAQIVKAEPPSPGGTRKVLLLLPDGNFMMTELSPEQYSSLELDK